MECKEKADREREKEKEKEMTKEPSLFQWRRKEGDLPILRVEKNIGCAVAEHVDRIGCSKKHVKEPVQRRVE